MFEYVCYIITNPSINMPFSKMIHKGCTRLQDNQNKDVNHAAINLEAGSDPEPGLEAWLVSLTQNYAHKWYPIISNV